MNAYRRAPFDEPIRVLLVEDSQDDHRLICDLLDTVADTRFSIEWAKDLAAGRDQLEKARFDVCLIDQRLPDGDGLDLLETIQIQDCPSPAIMLTGHGSVELDRLAMERGAAGFLDKNRIDPDLLARTIRYATRQQENVARLTRHVTTDELTGLVSRFIFHDRLKVALAAARRHDRLVATMIVDLEAAEPHPQDQASLDALKMAARRLTGLLRETDTVGRLADRQFAVIVQDLRKPEHAALVAQKMLDTLAPLAAEADDRRVIRPSIGIALYPKECGEVSGLLRQAHWAMRQARSEGGHRFRFGSDRIDRQIHDRFLLANDLKEAVDRDELSLRFRPQIHLTSDVVGLSGEIFWDRPDRGVLSADQFRSIVDTHGLIDLLTDWVVTRAAEQMRAWRELGITDVDLALPLLSRHVADWRGLTRRIGERLGAAGIPPGRIELDLDEALVIGDLASGGHGLAALKECGVRIAFDGFGHGGASLHRLRGDLLDSLKLSPELYRDLPGDDPRELLVKAIVGLGHDLDLRVVANGVRDERQFVFLKTIGCDAIQLRTSCPPLSADACTSWLRQTAQQPGRSDPRQSARPIARPETIMVKSPGMRGDGNANQPTLEAG